jgi:phosphatidylglycerol:prolipoprotein diacylglycerol transferase
MIPYLYIPDLRVGPLALHPFGILVAIAVFVGTSLARFRARRVGIDLAQFGGFMTSVVVFGFVGGHVIDAMLYEPRETLAHPLHLLALWDGQGSFGGFIGAVIGAFVWKHFELVPWRRVSCVDVPRLARRASPQAILGLADVVLSVFPVAWVIGRMGCAVAHDHPGVRASARSIFAVAYGPCDAEHVMHGPLGIELRFGDAPRYDLGTLELLVAAVLAIAVVLSWGRVRKPGFYVAMVPLAYAPVRFMLDFLRIGPSEGGDMRYGGLTPAQWSCAALFVLTLAGMGIRTIPWLKRRRPESPLGRV